MIFAEFFAPYQPTQTFENNTYHPANLQLTSHGLKVRECRTISRINWKYAIVKDEGYTHDFTFFANRSRPDMDEYSSGPDWNSSASVVTKPMATITTEWSSALLSNWRYSL